MPLVNSLEALHAFDYALGYELMREVMRRMLRTHPMRGLARYAGVTEDEFQAFMDGGDPGVALWAAGETMATGMEQPDVELDAVALNLLAATFPLAERVRARAELAAAIAPVLAGRVIEEVDG